MSIQVKICGLSDEESLQAAVEAGADFAGFVHFAASPRHVDFQKAARLMAMLPSQVASVCVTVDPNDTMLEAVRVLAPAYLQLHGTPRARIEAIQHFLPGQKVIEAFPVRKRADLEAAADSSADMLLFDAEPPMDAALPGGNGQAFDWTLLKDSRYTKQWLLSGGLTPDTVTQAIAQSGARMVDVSSGVERARGVKDAALIHAFIKAAKA